MLRVFKAAVSVVSMMIVAQSLTAEVEVVRDGGVSLSQEELHQLMKYWSPSMRNQAVDDKGLLLEFINMELAAKKVAMQADAIDETADPSLYWTKEIALRNAKRRIVVTNFLSSIEVPDMTDLAEERYNASRDKYALVPEQRYSSHILVACAPGVCNRDEKRPEAEEILQRLHSGDIEFADAVEQYSEDPGTKAKGGKFDKWMRKGEPNVVGQYVAGLFSIAEVGEYSDVVESMFGFHIIRFDDVRPSYHKSFDEVKPKITAELVEEYKKLAAKEWDQSFRLSDEAVIDYDKVQDALRPLVEAD